MSIYLTLAFSRYNLESPIFCFDRLRLSWQDNETFQRIMAESLPITEGVYWYDDEGVRNVKKDLYGKQLTFMPARSIAKYLEVAQLNAFDTAILAFLQALPRDEPVVLWWH